MTAVAAGLNYRQHRRRTRELRVIKRTSAAATFADCNCCARSLSGDRGRFRPKLESFAFPKGFGPSVVWKIS